MEATISTRREGSEGERGRERERARNKGPRFCNSEGGKTGKGFRGKEKGCSRLSSLSWDGEFVWCRSSATSVPPSQHRFFFRLGTASPGAIFPSLFLTIHQQNRILGPCEKKNSTLYLAPYRRFLIGCSHLLISTLAPNLRSDKRVRTAGLRTSSFSLRCERLLMPELPIQLRNSRCSARKMGTKGPVENHSPLSL